MTRKKDYVGLLMGKKFALHTVNQRKGVGARAVMKGIMGEAGE
jgi:hypothetical protein